MNFEYHIMVCDFTNVGSVCGKINKPMTQIELNPDIVKHTVVALYEEEINIDENCTCSIFCIGNRFLTMEQQCKRIQDCFDEGQYNYLLKYADYLHANRLVGKVEPHSMDKTGDNTAVSMQKKKKSFEVNQNLLWEDCRICGYQICNTPANVLFNGKAEVKQYIFAQQVLEQSDKMSTRESLKITISTSVKKKTDTTIAKNLNL